MLALFWVRARVYPPIFATQAYLSAPSAHPQRTPGLVS